MWKMDGDDDMKKGCLKKCILYLLAVVLAVITIYPLLWVFCASVSKTPQMGRISIIPVGFTVDRVVSLFTKYNFLTYFKNSFIYSFVATAFALVFDSMAAYSFARLDYPGRDKIFGLFLATMMVPFSIIMMPLYLMMRKLNLINTLFSLILPSMAGAYGVFLLRQFYRGIPNELEEAGRVDGLSYWGIYKYIMLPLSKPIMLTLAVLSFKANWNNYLWPTIVNGDEKTYVISQGLSTFSSYNLTDWNSTLTGAAVSMLPIIVIFIFFQKQLVEGIKLSGLKG